VIRQGTRPGAGASGPADHVALRRVLGPLRDEGILLVGSGGVTHDQGEFRRGYFGGRDVTVPAPFSRDFDGWVTEVVTTRRGEERAAALAAFERHPLAAAAHPTSEHFLPLLVVDDGVDAESGWPRAARFHRIQRRYRGTEEATRFGLPPSIDDRTAAAADLARIPGPCFRIDRLADRSEQAQL